MKKKTLRILAISVTAVLLVSSLSGCGWILDILRRTSAKTEEARTTGDITTGQRESDTTNGSARKSASDAEARAKTIETTEEGEQWDEILTEEAMPEAFYMDGAAESYVPYGNNALYGSPMLSYQEPDWNTEEYSYREENGWKSVEASPFSTFAADVDTASYANLRRMILNGQEIPEDAVRIEEMINYFHYDYPEPEGDVPFSVSTELAPCPWNEDTSLLLIGLQGEKPDTENLPPSNLVFLIDVSGSMDEPDKLPLVQRAFHLLTEQLGEDDRVSIVTYASNDQIVLDGVKGDETAVIDGAIEDLMAGGGTNGSQGIVTAYELAKKNYLRDGNNRVILATDGDLNIGLTDEGSLTRLIEEQAESGVYLSVLGFGQGNISDTNMEALADHGNGNYSYIDDIAEARKVLIQEIGGTLNTIADDVKIQVEFNPENVEGYRLIGYENRTMAAEDFANDKKDGGEIGAGHRVTALYEIAPAGSGQEVSKVESRYGNNGSAEGKSDAENGTDGEWLVVNVRYKNPGEETSQLLAYPVEGSSLSDKMSDTLSWAAGVAQIGMLLNGSEYAGTTTLESVRERLGDLPDTAKDDLKVEFLYLLAKLNSNYN